MKRSLMFLRMGIPLTIFTTVFMLACAPSLHAQGAKATPTSSATTSTQLTATLTATAPISATAAPTTLMTTTRDLLNQGIQAYTDGDLDSALATLKSAQLTFATQSDQQGEGEAWLYLGQVYTAQEEAEAARQALEKSALIWEELTDYAQLLEALQLLGALHLANLNYEQAMTTYATALNLAQKLDNTAAESTVTRQLAQAAYGRYHEQYQRDLAIAQQAGDATKTASLFNKLGDLYRGIHQFDEAIAAYEKELTIRRELQEPGNIADTLRAIGDLYATQENFAAATTAYQEAAALWTELKDHAEAAAVYNDLGVMQMKATDYDAAITAFEAELALRLQLKDQTKAAAAYDNLSTAYLAIENDTEAERTLALAATAWQTLDEPKKARDAQVALARLFDTQQAYPAAIEHYTSAISTTRTLTDEKTLAELLTDLATDYVAIGELSTAAPHYEEALTLWQGLERSADQLKVLRLLADLYRELEAPAQALNYLTLALPLATAADDAETVAKLYEDLGALYRANQAVEKSLVAYAEALKRWQQLAEPTATLDTLKALGDIYYRERRDYATALNYFTQGLTIAQAENRREDEADFLRRIGDSHEKQQAYALAITHYQQSLAIWSELQERAEQQKLTADITKTQEKLAEQQLALRTENGIVVPAADAVVSGVIDVRGLATDPNFQKWQLDLLINGADETASFLEVSRSAAPTVKRLFKLDTTLYPNGTHILRLRVVRTDFNYDEYNVKITIAN